MTPEYYATAKTIYDFWVGKKCTPAQAAGWLAQDDAEASLNPKAKGDKDKFGVYKAFGLAELHPDRIAVIKAGCGIDMATCPDVLTQLNGMWWELQHTAEHHAWKMVAATTTAYDAGFAACKYYERPGAPGQAEKRGALAQKWAGYFAPAAKKPTP